MARPRDIRRQRTRSRLKTTRVTVTLPVIVVQALDEFAAAVDTSRADALRMIVTPQIGALTQLAAQANKFNRDRDRLSRAVNEGLRDALKIAGLDDELRA